MAKAKPMSTDTKPTPERPDLSNYGISTEAEGMLSWEWVDEQMAKSRNYWICTTRPDGRPHATPVWGVWIEGSLYFGCEAGSRKARNLAANPEVVVHLESGDDTVIFEGTIEKVADRALLKRISSAYAAKYPPFEPDLKPEDTTFTVNVRMVFAWLESDFVKTATRWRFGED